MKKVFYLVSAMLLMGVSAIAKETTADWNIVEETASMEMAYSTSGITIPSKLYGPYFNGQDFVYVQDGWVRIVVSGDRREYDYHAEKDPWGNYALTLKNGGGSITLYTNGSLNCNGVVYKKK